MFHAQEGKQLFPFHGLRGKARDRVFDLLFGRQGGACAICGVSDAEMVARYAKNSPTETPWRRMSNVHYRFYIDHCHITGMIRGLLCQPCNTFLGYVESRAFTVKPETIRYVSSDGTCEEKPYADEDYILWKTHVESWLTQHKKAVDNYMQSDKWLPR